MTDIVQDLREHHAAIGFDDHTETWLTVAADEIERLREELYEIKLAAAGGEDVPGAANMVTANDVEKWVTKYCEEIERLREALREMLSVAEVDQLENLSICDIGSERSKMKSRAVASRCGMLLGKLRKIARAALGEGK